MNTLISLVFIITLISFVKTEFIYSCTEKNTIALTFDDGPHEHTRFLVDYLKSQKDVEATFFTVAKFHYPYAVDVEEYQEAMKLAHDSGFQIASHTYKHKIPEDPVEFKKALTDNDDFIEKVTGDRPRYFRAPKGHCNSQCQANLDEWGYRLIQWDSDTKDWDLETSGSVERRIEDSINYLKEKFAEERDSYLILMHDSENYTVSDIAPWIIEKSGMREKGYRFVTVAECLGDKEGMYRSGNTYGRTAIPGNDTDISNIVVDENRFDDNIFFPDNEQNLDTSGVISMKPTLIYTLASIFAYGALFLLINQL